MVFTVVLVVTIIFLVSTNLFTPSITMAQIGNRLSNGNPNSGLSSTDNTYFTMVNGTIHSTQNNENGKWLLSGKWSNTLASILGHWSQYSLLHLIWLIQMKMDCITIQSQEE